MKLANISRVDKAKDPLDKTNCRPLVSYLSFSSKIYERLIFDQPSQHANKTLTSKLLCGFKKAHSTQHSLFKLLQSWQKALDNSQDRLAQCS